MQHRTLNDRISHSALYFALITAWIAMMGSLYFSEVQGYIPCTLCWYQRILMYPLAGIIAIGLLRADENLPHIVIPFTLFGQGISTYHYLIQKTTIFGVPTACTSGAPCTGIWINWLGFITIPFLAMTAFFIITILALIALTSGQPDPSQHRNAPWASVITIIVIVLAGYWFMAQGSTNVNWRRWLGSGESQPASTAQVAEFPTVSEPSAMSLADGTTTTNGTMSIELGQSLYQEACSACHGPRAEGVPNLGVPLAQSEIIDQANESENLTRIRDGILPDSSHNTTGGVMPPSGGRPDLTDQELLAIIDYLRTL